jgi:hypothetical protein
VKVVISAGFLCAAVVLCADQPPSPHAAVLSDFEKRLGDYSQLRDRARSGLPRLKDGASPEAITRHEKALAERLRAVRSSAQPGDIFTPDAVTEFRRLITEAMKGREAALVHQSLKHAEPVKFTLRVNETYPRDLPLQSTPPTLLLYLPELPSGLDYRVLGHDLILRDAEANVIIDFISGVVP